MQEQIRNKNIVSSAAVQLCAQLRYSLDLCAIVRHFQRMVRKGRRAGSPAKISVLLNEDEAERFEAYCHEQGFKKSTLIARLIREHLDQERFQAQRSLFADNGRKGK